MLERAAKSHLTREQLALYDSTFNNSATISQDLLKIRRRLGAYYTPSSAAQHMANWVLDNEHTRVLEPSVGDGTFVQALSLAAIRNSVSHYSITAVDLDLKALQAAREATEEDVHTFIHEDFLSVAPTQVDAVIGNPPYVRLRHLEESQRQSAFSAAKALGLRMEPSGSVWMPFVMHATRFLRHGGRLALVLPYEMTFVRYAKPLWSYLSDHFGELRVQRCRERLFPDLMQDVVILYASDFGDRTSTIAFEAHDRISDLLSNSPSIQANIQVADVIGGERPFVEALLDPRLRALLREVIYPKTHRMDEEIRFNIGYVAGDKHYFHPSDEEVLYHSLPAASLRPTLTSTRRLRKQGLFTSKLDGASSDVLFLPSATELSEGELAYIARGERAGVSDRYKCRVRSPWYVVPGVKRPDIILGVFSDSPLMLINDGEYAASNSLLCGYLKTMTPEAFSMSWYSILSLLQCELEVHSLGGGVLILIPGEVSNIRLIPNVELSASKLKRIDDLLRSKHPEDAYRVTNESAMHDTLGLHACDISLIEEGITTLRNWRTTNDGNATPSTRDRARVLPLQ